MNRRTFITATAGVITAAVLSTPAQAVGPNWELLGSKRVNWLIDRDTVHVGPGAGTFRKIRLRVRGNGLFMHHLKVTFRNGGVQHIPVRFHFAQGSMTRVIDLRGNNRKIRKITMIYSKPWNGNGPTRVKVWGKH